MDLQPTDGELVIMSLKDPDQFGKLMERYESKLFRFVRRLTGYDPSTIEDILQETFIKIYQHLNDYNPTLSFSAWAYRIARNESINHFRKAKSSRTVSLDDDNEDTQSLIKVLKDKTDIPEDFKQKESGDEVLKILSMLSLQYRDVLILKFLEEMSYEEISDILKIPMGTVATLISRAKKQFKMIAEKNNLKFD